MKGGLYVDIMRMDSICIFKKRSDGKCFLAESKGFTVVVIDFLPSFLQLIAYSIIKLNTKSILLKKSGVYALPISR